MSLGCLSSANCLWAFLCIILRRGFLLGLHVYPAHYCNKLVLCSDSPIFQWSVEFTRLRNNGVWGSHYVISMHRTVIIQLFRGKYSVPFYGTFKVKIKSKAKVWYFVFFWKTKIMKIGGGWGETPYMILKCFGCTTIHNKALYKCILYIHSFKMNLMDGS